ncbi:hypothetical protein [Arthrobacter sp. C152]
MMTLTGDWNAIIGAFPAFVGSARVASAGSRPWRAAGHSAGLRRR